MVENLLEDLRVHTHGLPSQYQRGANKSQQIRAIITTRSRKKEDFDLRNSGYRKYNYSSESNGPYPKSYSPDMYRRLA